MFLLCSSFYFARLTRHLLVGSGATQLRPCCAADNHPVKHASSHARQNNLRLPQSTLLCRFCVPARCHTDLLCKVLCPCCDVLVQLIECGSASNTKARHERRQPCPKRHAVCFRWHPLHVVPAAINALPTPCDLVRTPKHLGSLPSL
jgi:hypothetical protein